jgi:hypothetical protein
VKLPARRRSKVSGPSCAAALGKQAMAEERRSNMAGKAVRVGNIAALAIGSAQRAAERTAWGTETTLAV